LRPFILSSSSFFQKEKRIFCGNKQPFGRCDSVSKTRMGYHQSQTQDKSKRKRKNKTIVHLLLFFFFGENQISQTGRAIA